MSDVAREAGVALVTVSRVINEPERVAPATREAVQAAVKRLGYVPNLTAGSLASSRSHIVAAIVPTLANLVFSETIEALSHTLSGQGYQLLVGQSGYDAQAEAALVEAFLSRRVDGLVLTGCQQAPAMRARLRQAVVPVVHVWDLPRTSQGIDMAVGFSNRGAGRAAAMHLLARGHHVLGFLGADEHRSRARFQGFAAAARQAGAEVLQAWMPPPATMAEAAAQMVALLVRDSRTSAVFCTNDLMATAVLFECQRRGWAVPGRLAIVGFGDLPMAQAAAPRLSTVRVHRGQIGAQAGQLLLDRLDPASDRSASSARCIDIGFELVVRESS